MSAERGPILTRTIEEVIGRGLARWVHAISRRPLAVVVAFALVTVPIGFYAARNLGIQGATETLFSSDLPFRQAERRYQEAFPAQYENMFVVVDAPTPERAGEAATMLLTAIEADDRHFRAAYLPGGGEFFDTHAFLYLDTPELETLADRLVEVQPYLAELARDGSLRGFASMLARGTRAARDGDVSSGRLDTIFESFTEALNASVAGSSYQVSWAEVLAGDEFDVGARRRFLLVQPVLEYGDLQPAKRPILAVRRIAHELGLSEETGVRVRITGDAVLSYEEMESLRTQATLAGIASFVLVGIILGAGLRSGRLVAATLCTLVVGLVWTAGFTTAAIGHLNLISVSFAVLFIGLGVDFGIHLCIRYRELVFNGHPHDEALTETARDVGSSLVLCATTTAVGFFAFVPTDFVGVAELGIISGSGMFVSLFCTLTLLPALLSLRPLSASGRSGADGVAWGAGPLTELPLRHPRAVRATAFAFFAGAIFLLPQARFDNNPLRVRDPSTESVRTFADLLEKGSTSPWSLNAVAPDLLSADALAGRLRELDVVGRVVSVSDFIPSDQEEKLGIIEDVALLLAPPPGPDGLVPRPSDAEQIAALEGLADELRRLLESPAANGLAPSATKLRDAVDGVLRSAAASDDPAPLLATAEVSMLGALPEQLRMLESALSAGHVTLENLPDAMLERMVATDGRVRIQIFPAHDLGDHAALAAFVDGVRGAVPEVAGSASEILESGRTVVRALRQALLSAAAVISLALILLWRRITDTALVLVPLGLAAAFTVAGAVIADIPFNFADVIVLPLLLGIGVDSGIHLVHRARMAGGRELNLLHTSTARAVAVSALTTIASFGTLGLASHLGLATLGRLLTLGVSFTVLCNLVVLPALLILRRPRTRLVTVEERAISGGR